MARFYADRVGFTTATTGTGTITAGTAIAGRQTLASAGCPNAATLTLCIEDGNAWEVSDSVYTASGTTLTRVLIASSTGALLSLSGTATVFLTLAARDVTGSVTTVALTTGTIPKAASATTLGDSVITESAGNVVLASGALLNGIKTRADAAANVYLTTPDTSYLNVPNGNSVYIGRGSGAASVGRTDGGDSVAVGALTLTNNTSGVDLTAIGLYALYANTTGGYNSAVGNLSLYANTTGSWSTVMGNAAAAAATTGGYNCAFGGYAMAYNVLGTRNCVFGTNAMKQGNPGSCNVIMGYEAGYYNSGDYNTVLGYAAGQNNVTGARNVFLGAYAGLHELGSDAFYVNNQNRTDTAGDKAKSLLYGVFAAAAADQLLIVNAKLGINQQSPASALHGTTSLVAATGDEIAYQLNYTTNKATSGNDIGLRIGMTDTLSPGTSLLIDAQVGGASKFTVSSTGVISTPGGVAGTGSATGYFPGGLRGGGNAGGDIGYTNGGVTVASGSLFGWTAGASPSAAFDTTISRYGAGVMQIGTTAANALGSLRLLDITTGAPNGGTAGAWKFGVRVAATVALDTTQYLQVDIGGTLYKLCVST